MGELCSLDPICRAYQPTESPLLTCETCLSSVHAACYGADQDLSNTSFICERCAMNPMLGCVLCPYRKGALRRATNGNWVHILCALYVAMTTVDDDFKSINIDMVEWGQPCTICESRGHTSRMCHGVTARCTHKGCEKYMHVTCAQKYSELVLPLSKNDLSLGIRCKEHMTPDYNRKRKISQHDIQPLSPDRKLKHTNKYRGDIGDGIDSKITGLESHTKKHTIQKWEREVIQQSIDDFVQQQGAMLKSFLDSHVTLDEDTLNDLRVKIENTDDVIRYEEAKQKILEAELREQKALHDQLTGKKRDDRVFRDPAELPKAILKALLIMEDAIPEDLKQKVPTPDLEEQFLSTIMDMIASPQLSDVPDWALVAKTAMDKVVNKKT